MTTEAFSTSNEKAKKDQEDLKESLQIVEFKVTSLLEELKAASEKLSKAEEKVTKVEEENRRLSTQLEYFKLKFKNSNKAYGELKKQVEEGDRQELEKQAKDQNEIPRELASKKAMVVILKHNQDCNLSFLEELKDEIVVEWQKRLAEEAEGSGDEDIEEETDDLTKEINEAAEESRRVELEAEINSIYALCFYCRDNIYI